MKKTVVLIYAKFSAKLVNRVTGWRLVIVVGSWSPLGLVSFCVAWHLSGTQASEVTCTCLLWLDLGLDAPLDSPQRCRAFIKTRVGTGVALSVVVFIFCRKLLFVFCFCLLPVGCLYFFCFLVCFRDRIFCFCFLVYGWSHASATSTGLLIINLNQLSV